jgi:hypothetical protein
MPQLRRLLYQRIDGADEDRWGLVFDTDANRLCVEHEKKRGDMRGSGYAIAMDKLDIADFLSQRGQGQNELVLLLGTLFQDRKQPLRS